MSDNKNSENGLVESIKNFINGRLDISYLANINIRYLLFVTLLVFLYITNHLSVDKNLRRLSELTSEIKELRYESITTSAELMNMSKQSEVLRRIDNEGLDLKELTEPPRILEAN